VLPHIFMVVGCPNNKSSCTSNKINNTCLDMKASESPAQVEFSAEQRDVLEQSPHAYGQIRKATRLRRQLELEQWRFFNGPGQRYEYKFRGGAAC
jgi:hypothetical protein